MIHWLICNFQLCNIMLFLISLCMHELCYNDIIMNDVMSMPCAMSVENNFKLISQCLSHLSNKVPDMSYFLVVNI